MGYETSHISHAHDVNPPVHDRLGAVEISGVARSQWGGFRVGFATNDEFRSMILVACTYEFGVSSIDALSPFLQLVIRLLD